VVALVFAAATVVGNQVPAGMTSTETKAKWPVLECNEDQTECWETSDVICNYDCIVGDWCIIMPE
jgi:hypothetical protein